MKTKVMIFTLILLALSLAQEDAWKFIEGSLPGKDNIKKDDLLNTVVGIDTATQIVKIVGLTDSSGWKNKSENQWAAADTGMGLKRARTVMRFFISNGIPAFIADPGVETLTSYRGVRVMIVEKSTVYSKTVFREVKTELDPLWFEFNIEPDTTTNNMGTFTWESNGFKANIPFIGQQGSVGEEVVEFTGDSGWVKIFATVVRDSEEISISDSIFVIPVKLLPEIQEGLSEELPEDTTKSITVQNNPQIAGGFTAWSSDWTVIVPTFELIIPRDNWSVVLTGGWGPYNHNGKDHSFLMGSIELFTKKTLGLKLGIFGAWQLFHWKIWWEKQSLGAVLMGTVSWKSIVFDLGFSFSETGSFKDERGQWKPGIIIGLKKRG